jgi:hypothetical protein
VTTSYRWSVLAVVLMFGCSAKTEGTESAARKYYDAEFKKWVGEETSAVATKRSQRMLLAPPISYDIRSIVRGEPDFLACQDVAKLPPDWKNWPAFKLNVALEWKAEDGSPMTDVTRYLLTWNANEKRWYVTEQF